MELLNELIGRMLMNKKASNNYAENNDSIKKYKVLFGKAIEPEDFESLLAKDDESIKKICLLYTSPSPRDATLSREAA